MESRIDRERRRLAQLQEASAPLARELSPVAQVLVTTLLNGEASTSVLSLSAHDLEKIHADKGMATGDFAVAAIYAELERLWLSREAIKVDTEKLAADLLKSGPAGSQLHVLDLVTKLQFVLDRYVASEEGRFTFPDGDTWDCAKATTLKLGSEMRAVPIRPSGSQDRPGSQEIEGVRVEQHIIAGIKAGITEGEEV